jgi:CubicO group peptidase (beta-lactamase class C family)
VAACGRDSPAPPAPPLRAPRPAADPALLLRAGARAAELDPINALVVFHRDTIVLEQYARGMRADRAVNVKSLSKTVLSPLVAIAIRDSLIRGLDQPIQELLPRDFAWDTDSSKQQITIRHLLSMRAGLQSTSFDNYGPWVTSRDWVRFALEQPLRCTPGTCYEYSTGNTHLLSAILTRAAGTDLISWGNRVLFRELGIALRPWDRDPQGTYLGGNNMRFTPRELVTFGRLFLDSGRVSGREMIPRAWIAESWKARAYSPWNGGGAGTSTASRSGSPGATAASSCSSCRGSRWWWW